MRTRAALSLTMLLGGAAGSPLPTQAASLIDNSVTMSFGTFLLQHDTRVTLNGGAGQPGTEVNLGRDLGLKEDGTWRFFKRYSLRVMYFDTHEHADKRITRDLTIGATVYPASASLHADHSTTVAELCSLARRQLWNHRLGGRAHREIPTGR